MMHPDCPQVVKCLRHGYVPSHTYSVQKGLMQLNKKKANDGFDQNILEVPKVVSGGKRLETVARRRVRAK